MRKGVECNLFLRCCFLLLVTGGWLCMSVGAKPSSSSSKGGKVSSSSLVNAMQHDIQVLTSSSFDAAILKHRTDRTSSVLFYKKTDDCKKLINNAYNELAKDLKGMIKISAIDCGEFAALCDAEGATEFPSVKVFPPNPIPAFFYKGKLERKDLSQAVTRYISGMVKAVDAKSIDVFLTTHIAVPKVLLFSNKKSAPLLFRALSTEFKDKLDFGFVHEEQSDLVKRFKVPKFPTVLLQKGEKKTEFYSGEMNFQSLFEWMNVFSETFVKGGGFSDNGSGDPAESKPWLVQPIPELSKQSYQDVCFKYKGLCVIYLKEGEITGEETAMLIAQKERFVSQLSDRGVTFYWMWMDTAIEKQYGELFGAQATPGLVVLNAKKEKKRFAKLDSSKTADKNTIKEFVDGILGGDGQFKHIKELPKWTERADASATAPKKDEL